MVLALSYEDREDVHNYVTRTKLRLRVAAEFTNAKDWGAGSSYPSSALVNTRGELIWLGHPSAVDEALIEQALGTSK